MGQCHKIPCSGTPYKVRPYFEGAKSNEIKILKMLVMKKKSEFDPVQGKAWVNAIRTHVVVPLIK